MASRHFFSEVLQTVTANDERRGRYLLNNLSEPKETHLGLSTSGSNGRGVGNERAYDLWDALRKSAAVNTGLVNDLEDTALLIFGIDKDVVSDIATNIIREPLIEYTQAVSQVYGIPLTQNVHSGVLWNPQTNSWYQKFTDLPIVNDTKIILVPKVIVRYRPTYEQDKYYRGYLLEELRREEYLCNSPLIELLKNGKTRITQKALMEKYGTGKSVLVEQTLRHPDALNRYRSDNRMPQPPLSHLDISRDPETDVPDWGSLLSEVVELQPGRHAADAYEKAVESLLYALFYPALSDPRKQTPIHDGRKRIDITFVNSSHKGFFNWLSTNYVAPYIFVECKNYTNDPGNPEIDQLSGRFSPLRGQCGILVCRSFDDKELFLKRCRDTAMDHRGFIIALDDEDLRVLVQQRENSKIADELNFSLLRQRFEGLIH
ncbi:MAG: hypothetical protein ABFD91_01885 [Anaerohalosphaeraceae bacterium]